MGTDADNHFSFAKLEHAAFDDLDLRSHLQTLGADTAHGGVALGAVQTQNRQRGIESSVGERAPVGIFCDSRGVRNNRRHGAGDSAWGVRLSHPVDDDDGAAGIARVCIGAMNAFGQRHHREQHADGGGKADHDHHGPPDAQFQAFEVKRRDSENLPDHVSAPTLCSPGKGGCDIHPGEAQMPVAPR